VFTVEIGNNLLAAVFLALFGYLVTRWWSFRARGPRA
jgi:hypothetical protein